MTRILLVSSEAEEMHALAAGLKSQCLDCQLLTTDNVDSCVQHAADPTISCIVADATQFDGAAVGDLVKKFNAVAPSIPLVMLCHNPAEQTFVENCRANQRAVSKSAGTEHLVEIIKRCWYLQNALNSEKLKAAVGEIKHLPTLPTIYKRLLDEVSANDSSAYSVSQIVETDSALLATILRVVNSAFYGLSRPVESASQAVSLLGVHMVKNITLTTKVFSEFSGNQINKKRLEALNDNANRKGALANHFGRLASVPREIVDKAQIAGMLDGVGELILLSRPDLSRADDNSRQATLLSAYLLRMWLMPEDIVEAVVLRHQTPDKPFAKIDPLCISYAIHYLDNQLDNVDDAQQVQRCTEQLAQWIPEALVAKWVQAYCDLQQLITINSESSDK